MPFPVYICSMEQERLTRWVTQTTYFLEMALIEFGRVMRNEE